MKIEVTLHKKSEKQIKDTLSSYSEADSIPFQLIIERCIIHMYPYEDTMQEDGELNGYADALNFEAHIYDTKKKTVYKSKFHDAIFIDAFSEVKYFKDLSTMIIFDKPIEIMMGKGIHISKI